MADEAIEELDSQDQPTEEVVNTEEVEETPAQEESEDLNTLQEQNKRLFERAKKAESEAKLLKAERLKKEEVAKVEAPSQKQDGLSSMDTIALINAKVTEKEDIEEVMDYAKLKNIPISDALNANVVKTILKEKAENRATAEATNTGTARRGSTKPTDEQVLADAAKGKEVDPEALAQAHFNEKFGK